MTTIKLNLESLEATAEAADGGPWWKYDDHDIPDYQVLDAFHHLICSCGNDNGDANNAAHIAAFDPPTALAMIAEIRRLEDAFNLLSDKWSNERDKESLKLFEQKSRADKAEAKMAEVTDQNNRLQDLVDRLMRESYKFKEDRDKAEARLSVLWKLLTELDCAYSSDGEIDTSGQRHCAVNDTCQKCELEGMKRRETIHE